MAFKASNHLLVVSSNLPIGSSYNYHCTGVSKRFEFSLIGDNSVDSMESDKSLEHELGYSGSISASYTRDSWFEYHFFIKKKFTNSVDSTEFN